MDNRHIAHERLARLISDLGSSSALARVCVASELFNVLDRLAASDAQRDWARAFASGMDRLVESLAYLEDRIVVLADLCGDVPGREEGAITARTGKVYFELWKRFSDEEYYRQAVSLLETRASLNAIDLSRYDMVLDNGCGGGRYAYALSALGCTRVIGLDASGDSVAFGAEMCAGLKGGVEFAQGSVLSLPFPDETFDLVFSNGVLHHTIDPQRGLAEAHRVLRHGGRLWLYLYGGKDAFFWDVVDTCRHLLREVPQKYTQLVMEVLGCSAGRIFHRCDFWYVPIQHRYRECDVAGMLREAGFSGFERMRRGVGYDWDEVIYRNPKLDPYIYGEGEMRFWVRK